MEKHNEKVSDATVYDVNANIILFWQSYYEPERSLLWLWRGGGDEVLLCMIELPHWLADSNMNGYNNISTVVVLYFKRVLNSFFFISLSHLRRWEYSLCFFYNKSLWIRWMKQRDKMKQNKKTSIVFFVFIHSFVYKMNLWTEDEQT